MKNTLDMNDSPRPSRLGRAEKVLSYALLVLSLLLAVSVSARGVRVGHSLSLAREAVSSGSWGGPPERTSVALDESLPEYGALDVIRVSVPMLGEGLVLLEASDTGTSYLVRLSGTEVVGVEVSNPPRAEIQASSDGPEARTSPSWRLAVWDADAVADAAEGGSSTVAIARGVSVVGGATHGVLPTQETSAAISSGDLNSFGSAEETGTLSITGENPVQYSVIPLPGDIRTQEDAFLLPREWMEMTGDLSGRTGFTAVSSYIVPASYGGRPAVVGYAEYRSGERTQIHHLLAVYLPDSGRMVLVAGQEDLRDAVPEASESETLPVSPQATEGPSGRPAHDPLSFARESGLVIW